MIIQFIIVISTALFTLSASAGFARPLLFARLNTADHKQKPLTAAARFQGYAITTHQRRANAKMTAEQYQQIEKQLQQPVTTSELESSLKNNSHDHEDLKRLLAHNKKIICAHFKNQQRIRQSLQATRNFQINSGMALAIGGTSWAIGKALEPLDTFLSSHNEWLDNHPGIFIAVLPVYVATLALHYAGAFATGISVPLLGGSSIAYAAKKAKHSENQKKEESLNVMRDNAKLLHSLIESAKSSTEDCAATVAREIEDASKKE